MLLIPVTLPDSSATESTTVTTAITSRQSLGTDVVKKKLKSVKETVRRLRRKLHKSKSVIPFSQSSLSSHLSEKLSFLTSYMSEECFEQPLEII